MRKISPAACVIAPSARRRGGKHSPCGSTSGLASTAATIDAADKADQCVEVKASHVVLRGLALRSPRKHGIVLGQGAHDVVIEGCDISDWGRVDKDGWGVDYDFAVYSKYEPLTRVVIQRNRMHDPRSNSNSWQEFREGGARYHPKGPQAICFFESAGNHVFCSNEFTTDENHYCNDIFGGGANRSLRGFAGADSDVYGNRIEGCWDDGLEMEGGGCNVRVWANRPLFPRPRSTSRPKPLPSRCLTPSGNLVDARCLSSAAPSSAGRTLTTASASIELLF